ncbi:nucleoside triphosphate pyrophosphohydrolase [Symbiobacterium thermophilum]|nr:nucleoside triphosphate pyrophosphohydrolase [Symbiobacterium thermophilum]
MEDLLRAFDIHLADGLEVRPAARLRSWAGPAELPLLIPGVLPGDLGAVQRALLPYYPADHPVRVRAEGRVHEVPLDGLAGQNWGEYRIDLFLAPPARAQRERWPLDPLVEVMDRLRGPDGCPWDREQTHETLRRYMLEEAYEAVEAIDDGDPDHLCEELGDVLLQVVFHAQIAREAGRFDMRDVVAGITEKLIRRHPHVFGDASAETAEEVTRRWDAIKRAERGGTGEESLLSGVSRSLPALSRACELQKRAAGVGFDWEDAEGPAAKVREELAEVLGAPPGEREAEVGDLLFAAVNLARKLGVDPELALTRASAKFEQRFRYVERRLAEKGLRPADVSLAEMDALWEEGKRVELRKKYGGK